ncbi:hypothetical protein RA19_18080 [Leisingera sp. ANG-M1]|uniref:acetate--CoA ligase family protein n=1 Tax=Leisingera sp. ANG-M1 TaxID=1577895 RepID=UPI00057EDFD1|nr:acetate--CoA ligase family protein [Leisingera sp. ANG-M1]KIC08793.1 hypothetical protein RA19_18080 [Leisingera sp. ANG-M1]
MMHRLSPMFEARSMAVAGASARASSFGARLAEATLSGGFQGQISFINPRGGEILGRQALASIRELDHAPDVAVLGIGGANLEGALVDAIAMGAKSAVIFDVCHGETANGTPILARLKDIAAEAGIPICGGSGMGVINTQTGLVGSFYPADHMRAGGISLIAHSGSVFTVLGMNDPRFRFDLVASPGQEIGATVDEYIAYAASRETTKAIAVFMESARNPEGLVEALKLARDAGKPVVICKVGRTEESARLARSHTGALAGSHAAYEAVFEECGAISVDTVDALMNTALLCSGGRIPGPGGAGLVTDSGGLREMQVDLAAETGTPLAVLSSATRAALREALPPELEPSNPLDCAADLTDEFPKVFDRGLDILAAAPEVSMLGFEADLRDDYVYEPQLLEHARQLRARTDKPVFFYASFGQTHNRGIGEALAEAGVPCLNGAETAMQAVKAFQAWADGLRAEVETAPEVPGGQALPADLDEAASLEVLSGFGVPGALSRVCSDAGSVAAAGQELGFPVVLKTAEAGIDHKSDLGGVILNLGDEIALAAAYADLSARLGPRAVVQKQASKGVELAFGCVMDPDFGPLVMVAPGGTLVELFDERQFARAPFGPGQAEKMIRRLRVAKLIDGVRGDEPRDMAAAAQALSAFSVACAAMRDQVAEIDVNPVMVTDTGAMAVDALIVPAQSAVREAAE